MNGHNMAVARLIAQVKVAQMRQNYLLKFNGVANGNLSGQAWRDAAASRGQTRNPNLSAGPNERDQYGIDG